MSTKRLCAGLVWSGWNHYPCSAGAKHEHDGRWYCKRHHPPAIKEKQDARTAKWEAKWRAEQEALAAEAEERAENARRAALYPELLEALRGMLREHDAITIAAGGKPGITDRWPERAAAARAVIEKATGETK